MSQTTAFSFKALRPDGDVERGVVAAGSRDAVLAVIRSRGSFPITVRRHIGVGGRVGRKPRIDQLAAGLRAFSTLLDADLPISRILTVMEDLAPPPWQRELPGIQHRVSQGESLSNALADSDLGIPPHVLGLIRAGEAGGGLSSTVERAATLLEQQARRRNAIQNALTYPLILAVAGSASLVLLIGIVLPRFADLLADTGRSLPVLTRVVLAAGTTFMSLLPVLVPPTVLVAVAASLWIATPGGRLRWHRFWLSIPGISGIRQSVVTANACATLAALLQSGIPLSAALPHAADATGDEAVKQRLAAARERLAQGESFAAAIRSERAMSPTAIQLIGIGEETGRLAALVSHAAVVEGDQAQDGLQRLTRAIEPAMIMLFGGLVLIVAAAVMQAMYGLTPSL